MSTPLQKQDAFTLLEMVIAITVFTLFMGAVMTTYLQFHRSQREVQTKRAALHEMQAVMDQITQSVKEGSLHFEGSSRALPLDALAHTREGLAAELSSASNSALNRKSLYLLSDSGEEILFEWDSMNQDLSMQVGEAQPVVLHSEDVDVSFANFRVFPAENPYEDVLNSNIQYQAHVKIELEFTVPGRVQDRVSLSLETSVTSRNYQ